MCFDTNVTAFHNVDHAVLMLSSLQTYEKQ